MPIVDVEIIGEQAPVAVQELADGLGQVFGSNPASTWVRLRWLPADCYAENAEPGAAAMGAAFVTVLQHTPPEGEARRQQARRIAAAVAKVTHRSREHVHVLFQPAAAGRVAFGGELRD